MTHMVISRPKHLKWDKFKIDYYEKIIRGKYGISLLCTVVCGNTVHLEFILERLIPTTNAQSLLFMSVMNSRTQRSRRKYEDLCDSHFDRNKLLINHAIAESIVKNREAIEATWSYIMMNIIYTL